MADHEFAVNDATVHVVTEKTPLGLTVKLQGGEALEFLPLGNGVFSVTRGGQKHIVAGVRHKDLYYVDVDSIQIEIRDASDDSSFAGAQDHAGGKDKIFAPMPGKIVKVLVSVGDNVDVKQPMVIVEAMKMENQVNSMARGKVKSVNFQAGDQVNTEQPIIELDLAPEAH